MITRMLVFRRMRTLLVPPLFGLTILLLWTTSSSNFSIRSLDRRHRLCVSCDPLQLRHELPSEPLTLAEFQPQVLQDGPSDHQEHPAPDDSQEVESGEIGNLFQSLAGDSSTSHHHNDTSSLSEREAAMEEVDRVMEFLRSQGPEQIQMPRMKPINSSSDSPDCSGRTVFVYDLPTKFNSDLLRECATLIPWMSMCDFLGNSGMGSPIDHHHLLLPSGSWFLTHQYSLELIFHSRIMQYACRVEQPDIADVLYVPFYAGLDVLRWNFAGNVTNQRRDTLAQELLAWLYQHSARWRLGDRRDHVLVLGKVTWDFRRATSDAAAGDARWGSRLLELPEVRNVTRLLIERHPWRANDVGVPHPTFFHPGSDADVREWQERVLSQASRSTLVAFAGQPRPGQSESIRGELIRQCTANPDECRLLDCAQGACFRPENTLSLFLDSDFCLQPAGDSPTRRSVFDSLLAGCIPVLFDPFTAYHQYPWHLPADREDYSVFIPGDSVRPGGADVVEILRNIPAAKRREIRESIVRKILPGIVYARPGSTLLEFDDAFDIALRNLITKAASKKVYED